MFLAGFALLLLGALLRRPLPVGVRVWRQLACIGFGATFLAFLGMFHAAEYISPDIVMVIANTQPLMAAVLAAALLGEQLGGRGKFGLLVGFLGIVLIATPELSSTDQRSSLVGIAYILLAALGISVSNVLIKRLAGSVDPMMAMGVQLVLGGVPLSLLALLTEQPGSVQWTAKFIATLLTLAFFGTSLVYLLSLSLLESVLLNTANAFSFLIPLFGLAMGYANFGESFGWVEAFGAAITLVGLQLVVRGRE